MTYESAGLEYGSGDSRGGGNVGIVVGYSSDSERWGNGGNWSVARVALSSSAGKRVKVGWEEANFGDAAAPGFSATVVDDWFVRS